MGQETRIGDVEDALRRTASADLQALAVAEEAGAYLVSVIQAAPVPVREGSGSPVEVRHEALWLMAVLGFRALRAFLVLTASGYGDQAAGLQRMITELQARARKAAEDESGEYARQWLAGRPGGSGAKLIGQDFWEFLSAPPHGGIRAVLDWVAVSKDDGTTDVVLGPERRPEVANPTLTFIAGALRDVGHLLAVIANAPEEGLEHLDEKIKAAYDRFIPGAEPGTE